MNEQEVADALADQLDAFLTGEAPVTTTGELAELLHLAEQVSATAPAPRPEFGMALRQSLLSSAFGNGAASGLAFSGWLIVIVVVALMGLMTTVGLIVGFSAKDNQSVPDGNNSAPASAPAEADEVPAPSQTVEATATSQAADAQPAFIPTVIIDVIPPRSVTGEDSVELDTPSGLAPGRDSSHSGDGGDRGRGGDGDHNRGHGKDRDHHDEDNPGRSRD